VIALSDQNADLVESYSYDVFGQPSNTSDVNNPYLFTGRRYDDETGLYYYRARYYDYATGRFMQTDPIGHASGLNLYTYCGNNPLTWIDPFGDRTYAVGSGGLGGTGFFGGAAQEGWVIDSSGNIGWYELMAIGGGTPTIGGFGTFAVTSADEITDLSGGGGQGGISFFYGGGEIICGADQANPYLGLELSLGISPMPAEGHGHYTHTDIKPMFNIQDIYKNPLFVIGQLYEHGIYQLKKYSYGDEAGQLLDLALDLLKEKYAEKDKCKK